MNEKPLEFIENVLKKNLNKKWHSVYRALAIQLTIVCNSHKTGFIWDIGPTVHLSIIGQIIREIKMLCPEQNIRIITLGSDVCIINLKKFLYTSIDTIFVDVSRNLKAPQIVCDSNSKIMIETMISDVVQQCMNNDKEIIDIIVPRNACVPTLFGLFCGYPIIYWYNPSDDDNCLHNTPLSVFQLSIHNFLIYSVSCPINLLLADNQLLMERTRTWFYSVSKCMQKDGLSLVDFKIINKTISNVIL